MNNLKYGMVAVLALIALAMPRAVWADTEVRVINTAGGGDTGWVDCAGTSCSLVATVGNYSLTADIAIQMTSGNPLLDLTYDASTTKAGAGTLIFEAMANGYTTDTAGTYVQANGNSSLGDTITIGSYGGDSNSLCAAGVNACTPTSSALLASISTADGSYGLSANGGGNTVNPYALGLVVTLDSPTGTGVASGDVALNSGSVPEPGTLSLLGAGLLGVMIVSTRRRKFVLAA